MEYIVSTSFTIKEPTKFERHVYNISLAICGLSVIYLLTVFMSGNTWLPLTDNSSKLILSLIQCLLGMAALHVPMLITKLTRLKFPDALCSLFYVFVICGTVLGELFSLYYAVPCWDSLLHFGSGVMGGMLGSILVVHYCETKQCGNMISPLFIGIASVCFALCLGVVWEVYEFAADSLLGLNMQKCLLEDGTALVGKSAVFDTMKDILVDFGGALALPSPPMYP